MIIKQLFLFYKKFNMIIKQLFLFYKKFNMINYKNQFKNKESTNF